MAALASYRVLDTAPEPDFDGLTKLVAKILKVPIALMRTEPAFGAFALT